MAAVHELTPALGASAACRVLGLPRGASARHRAQMRRHTLVGPVPAGPARPRPPLAFTTQEKQAVLDALNSERFADTAPAAVHATLLDEGRYLGSVRTMYRLLAANGASCERRNQLTHPAYSKPELLAIAPNQVWSWDITKLKGEDRLFKRPFSSRLHPEHGKTTAEQRWDTAPEALEPAFGCRAKSVGRGRPSRKASFLASSTG